jgi:undecaprenyl-diphosphatase
MFDWTTLEAILMSLAQLLALIPGAGRMLGVLSFSTLRNFTREAAIKFALLAGFPISAYGATSLLREYGMGGSDWTVLLNFGATLITAAVASFLALLGITRSFQITGVRGHVLYRVLGGVGVALWIWIKSRG